ncbi:MAG: long-chain fatty acid--CoA ligase, partial [Clostridia bacterium]|nr:long-chain fatty acid--CoA ligase [Clostridia bacterium]
MPRRTIYSALTNIVEKNADARAIYYYGTRLTYRELMTRVNKLADAFWNQGVRPGDYVSFLMPTMPESIMSLYAINKIGATPNFIDPRMDIGRILDAAEGVHSRLLVSIDIAYPKVEKIMDRLTVEKIIFCSPNESLPGALKIARGLFSKSPKIPYGGNLIPWKEFLGAGNGASVPVAPYKDGSVAAIVYTGGTTGTPKGVLLSDDGLNTMAESFYYSGVDRGESDRFLAIMPIFASYGVGCGIHMPLMLGFELVVIPKFTPDKLGDLIMRYRPNHMMGVPSFYEQLMTSKAVRKADLSFLLTPGCGGDTMNPGLEDRFNAFLREHGGKYPLSQGYGMSEMSGAATCCFSANYKDGSSGIPLLATTAGIFSPETGEELPYNTEGEICMRGRNMMLGYY